ncbi:MAG: S26 family signal peptidase [Ruthenibacterium lactatiformans]
MGDNRPRSLDGRSTEVGFIDERDILGRCCCGCSR